MVYLDNAATTFPKPEVVWDTYEYWQRNACVNAGRGGYKSARQASDMIAETREKIAGYVGAALAEDVVFTSSATMAANVVLQGLSLSSGDIVYVSPYEHNAIMRTLHALEERKGIAVRVLPVDSHGRMDMDEARTCFEKEVPRLICVTQVSNVTGYCLPYYELFTLAKKYDAVTVLDSAQGLGVLPVHVLEEKIDFLLFAGHKNLYGPFGVGGFVNGSGMDLEPVILGGNGSDSLNLDLPEKGIERYEIGSPNLPAMAALGKAVELVVSEHEKRLQHERRLLSLLQEKLEVIPRVVVFGTELSLEERVGILSFACERYTSEDLGMILDEDFDIAVRTGYHCAPLVHDVIGSKAYGGTVRVGVSMFTVEKEVDALVEAVKELMEE